MKPFRRDRLIHSIQLGWTHGFEFAGYYVAKEKGYYAAAGLDVTISEGGPGKSCYAIMISGRAQYCADDGDNVYHFVKGTPMVALASIFQHSAAALITLKSSGLDSVVGSLCRWSLRPDPDGHAHARHGRRAGRLDRSSRRRG